MPNIGSRASRDASFRQELGVDGNMEATQSTDVNSGEPLDSGQDTTGIKVVPFADGLISARLNGLVIIPRAGGEEVELLRGFLRHFASAAPFAGNIVSKASFMRKKGGRLL